VPVIVRPVGEDYELVAGFNRLAAHTKLGEAQIDAEIRASDSEHADRAVENVARKQLNPISATATPPRIHSQRSSRVFNS
jgi:ParB-like chromosome segregation protein Spo0J